MEREKITTTIDGKLLEKARIEVATRKKEGFKGVNDVIERALKEYFDRKEEENEQKSGLGEK